MSSKAFLLVSKSPLICIERYLAFTAFFKIFGSTKPGFIFLLIDRDLRVNQLIGEVINAQDRKHSVHDDLIDAFMADDTVPRVIIAMSFVAGQTGVRGQQMVLQGDGWLHTAHRIKTRRQDNSCAAPPGKPSRKGLPSFGHLKTGLLY